MVIKSKITLLCPSCRSPSIDENGSKFVCLHCNKTFSRHEIERYNQSRIDKEVQALFEKKILPDIAMKYGWKKK
jgi:transposase-like protein